MKQSLCLTIGLCLLIFEFQSAASGEVPKAISSGPFRVVVEQGQHEPASIGSYSVRVYRGIPEETGDFISGAIEKRDGSISQVWVESLAEQANTKHVVVWCTSSGSGSYGTVDVFRMDVLGTLTRIGRLPTAPTAGYMGHDHFYIKNGTLYREFPIYGSGDSNIQPTGGTARYELDLKSLNWKTSNGVK